MSNPVIVVQDLRKTYQMGDTTVHALDGVSLQINKGELISIMGPSGSGKSTLMAILGCLDSPSSGTYRLDGIAVESLRDDQLANIRSRKIGFVFQQFNLLPRTSALENVMLPLTYAGVNGKERRDRAMQALAIVGLAERHHHRPNELSGGQQQRVAIARSLVNAPAILFADEPTGALDSKTSTEILDLFLRLHDTQGLTVCIVTHAAEVAERTPRIVRIRDGKIASDEYHAVRSGR